jgi:hypothetical protein
MAGIRGHHDDWPVLVLIVVILAVIALSNYRKVKSQVDDATRVKAAASASPMVLVRPAGR